VTRIVTYEPRSRERIEQLFAEGPDPRLAAAVDAVLEGLEQGRDTFRALEVDGEPFPVPDEVDYQDLRTAHGGVVRIKAVERPDETAHPTWAIVFRLHDDGAHVHVRFAGPLSEYDQA